MGRDAGINDHMVAVRQNLALIVDLVEGLVDGEAAAAAAASGGGGVREQSVLRRAADRLPDPFGDDQSTCHRAAAIPRKGTAITVSAYPAMVHAEDFWVRSTSGPETSRSIGAQPHRLR